MPLDFLAESAEIADISIRCVFIITQKSRISQKFYPVYYIMTTNYTNHTNLYPAGLYSC